MKLRLDPATIALIIIVVVYLSDKNIVWKL